jgi:hypothetical protein
MLFDVCFPVSRQLKCLLPTTQVGITPQIPEPLEALLSSIVKLSVHANADASTIDQRVVVSMIETLSPSVRTTNMLSSLHGDVI